MLSMEMGIAEKVQKSETEKSEKIPSLELLKIQAELQGLKNNNLIKEDREKYIELSRQTYKDLCSYFIDGGGKFITDVNQIYKAYSNSHPLIVRREDPEQVTALNENYAINLSFDPKVSDNGEKYANCAVWPYGNNPVAGIKNAFLEGRGMAGPIVSLIAVKDNPEHLELQTLDNSLLRIGDIEREAARIASGAILKEDLEFIILRIQKDFFPPESLSEAEKDEKVKQIFRGFNF